MWTYQSAVAGTAEGRHAEADDSHRRTDGSLAEARGIQRRRRMTGRFETYCRRREQAALAAEIPGYVTREDKPPGDIVRIGSDWSRAFFDGPFYRSAAPASDGTPITSLVFVQSRDGNTSAADPSTLGGGDTDLHLIYEGLSRVDADAVMAGATTARARDIVFSVWHPELVALRLALGRTRHPAQVVATSRADLRFEDGLMFNEPALKVFVITRTGAVQTVRIVRGIPKRPSAAEREGNRRAASARLRVVEKIEPIANADRTDR